MAPDSAAGPVAAGHLARGRAGEDATAAVYRARGFGVVARNWTCPLGELDLVLARGPLLVFCEVKSRRGLSFGGPHEAVTLRKQGKLRALAQAFLACRGTGQTEIRFDVASVTLNARSHPQVNLFEDAF